jgi:hypothetical protein
MAKFKVILERTDTITKEAEMVEANSAEGARKIILADLSKIGYSGQTLGTKIIARI